MHRANRLSFIINGNNFQAGGRTTVNLTDPAGNNVTATLSAVYQSAITGSVTIPSSDMAPGTYNVSITTLDGGYQSKKLVTVI